VTWGGRPLSAGARLPNPANVPGHPLDQRTDPPRPALLGFGVGTNAVSSTTTFLIGLRDVSAISTGASLVKLLGAVHPAAREPALPPRAAPRLSPGIPARQPMAADWPTWPQLTCGPDGSCWASPCRR